MPRDAPMPSSNGSKSLGYKQELNRTMSLYDVIVYGLIYMVPLAPLQVFGFATTSPPAWSRPYMPSPPSPCTSAP